MSKRLIGVGSLAALTVLGVLGARLWRSLDSSGPWPGVRTLWPGPATCDLVPPPPPPPAPCWCDEGLDTDVDEEQPQPRAAAGLRLFDGDGTEASVAQTTAALPDRVAHLPEAEVERILSSLAPLPQDDKTSSAPLLGPPPPPPTDKAIVVPFTPRESVPLPTPDAAGALTVLRAAPQGDVAWVAQLQVAFSQGMRAVGDESTPVAAGLTPEVPGRWRWLGSRVLTFEPKDRFPMATEFEVTVPAGLRSASGATLETPYRWRFTTPPPTLVARHPEGGPTRRDPLLFAAFDQSVDPQAVLATTRVTAGGLTRRLRLATPQEVAEDPDVRLRARVAGVGRWVAFRCLAPLPGGADVRVAVGPGTPSALFD
jgi:hypothetical protein